jgi:hypothetical protein
MSCSPRDEAGLRPGRAVMVAGAAQRVDKPDSSKFDSTTLQQPPVSRIFTKLDGEPLQAAASRAGQESSTRFDLFDSSFSAPPL